MSRSNKGDPNDTGDDCDMAKNSGRCRSKTKMKKDVRVLSGENKLQRVTMIDCRSDEKLQGFDYRYLKIEHANYMQSNAQVLQSSRFNINGSPEGYFASSRNLRQGDPLSPFLFVIAMQGLSSLLDEAVLNGAITPHIKCSDPLLSHLCFVDNLFIFTQAEEKLASNLAKVLQNFSAVSGLHPNLDKS
ncbi:hypothetical protein HHK36_020529 [Tetracentron sinense]|uniref:Reverse transcriptase domain-containing protein n=1 Tax=Tetracentron sinense TaxID=13715 RepID=A0A835DB45_TETSI|nr:hypothetical protein HHK36_020529 [Tetracentron sinense]